MTCTDHSQDSDLLHQVHTYGTKWAYIASVHSPVRTTLALKNRYSTLRLKSESKKRSRQGSSSTEASWSRDASTDTAMTSPTGQWSPVHTHLPNNWAGADDAIKFRDEMDGGGETEEDEDETTTPQDLPTWPSQQPLKVDTTNIPYIQASFTSWDAWARLNDASPSDGTHPTSCHISPVEAAPMSAESYLPLGSPLMMSRPSHHASSLPNYCFFGGEENRTTNQDAIYPLYGKFYSGYQEEDFFLPRRSLSS